MDFYWLFYSLVLLELPGVIICVIIITWRRDAAAEREVV
jgi:hypothetical protein